MVINLHLISQPQQNYEIDLSENRTALLKRSEYDFMPYNSSADVDYGYEQISSSNSHYDALGRNLKYSINLNGPSGYRVGKAG